MVMRSIKVFRNYTEFDSMRYSPQMVRALVRIRAHFIPVLVFMLLGPDGISWGQAPIAQEDKAVIMKNLNLPSIDHRNDGGIEGTSKAETLYGDDLLAANIDAIKIGFQQAIQQVTLPAEFSADTPTVRVLVFGRLFKNRSNANFNEWALDQVDTVLRANHFDALRTGITDYEFRSYYDIEKCKPTLSGVQNITIASNACTVNISSVLLKTGEEKPVFEQRSSGTSHRPTAIK